MKTFSSTKATIQTLPKAQRTRGLSSAYQSNFFRSCHKFLRKSRSDILRILTKNQPKNLETLCSKYEQKLNFMTKSPSKSAPNIVNMFLIVNMSNSNNLNKFWVVIFTCQGHTNQVY